MAFTKTTISQHGFLAENAYHRVECIALPRKDIISFHVRSYKTQGFLAFQDTEYTCDYDLNGPNVIKQAYEYLKTLPEFADATDC